MKIGGEKMIYNYLYRVGTGDNLYYEPTICEKIITKDVDIEAVIEKKKVDNINSSVANKIKKTGINFSKFPGSFANRRRWINGIKTIRKER